MFGSRGVSGDRPADAGTVAFVGGVGRSGSTLIELALGQFPQACALGEVRHLWERGLIDNERCGCGEAFDACPFWIEVGQRAFGGWGRVDVEHVLALKNSVDRTRYVPQLLSGWGRISLRQSCQEYVDLYRKIYAAAREISAKPVVLDSSKHISMAACLAVAEGVDLRVVHVVRNPVGVAYSWSKVKVRPEVTSHEAYMPRYSASHASLQWDTHNALYELFDARLGVPRMRLRYEDFVASPARTLVRAASFLGIDPPSWAEDGTCRTVELGVQHTVAGNPLRFRRGPVEVRVDDGWRSGMGKVPMATVLGLTFPLGSVYGYAGTRTRSVR